MAFSPGPPAICQVLSSLQDLELQEISNYKCCSGGLQGFYNYSNTTCEDLLKVQSMMVAL